MRGHVVGPFFPDQQLCPQLPWLLLCPPFPGHIRPDSRSSSSSSSHVHSALGCTAATASRVTVDVGCIRGDFRPGHLLNVKQARSKRELEQC